jgi:hypothetical protein
LAQGDPGLDTATRDVSRFFFGVDIQCARCHKHPEVREWKQESYWGMAAYLKRSYPLAVKGKTYLAEKASGEVEYATKARGMLTIQPVFLTGEKLVEPVKPVTPASNQPAAKAPTPAEDPAAYRIAPETAKEKTRVPVPRFSRREQLVAMAVNGGNPYFKRAAVNLVWSRLMGRGLVEPIDQMHDGNPASHPELLQALAEDFAAHRFDLRHLNRTITNSQTYQLSSRYRPSSPRPAEHAYASAALRPLSLHQLALSLLVATGAYDGLHAADPTVRADSASLRRKFEAQHQAVLSALMKNLDTGTEPFQPGIREALYQTNSPGFAELINKGGLARRLANIDNDAQLTREAFLHVLTRFPTAEEVEQVGRYLRARPGRRPAACEQIVWALVTSSEFRFNH